MTSKYPFRERLSRAIRWPFIFAFLLSEGLSFRIAWAATHVWVWLGDVESAAELAAREEDARSASFSADQHESAERRTR